MNEIGTLKYVRRSPESTLSAYVKWFWTMENTGFAYRMVHILPDGYFDLMFIATRNRPFKISLVGLATKLAVFSVPARSRTYAISFKLPAAESILNHPIKSLVDSWVNLVAEFWPKANLHDFDVFVRSTTAIMISSTDQVPDKRKQLLFEKIYETEGAITVANLSAYTHWPSRQINRYFKQFFGVTLKKYCTILRFRASFDQLKTGKLSPNQHYFDQPHFIREVNKFSGTSPKQLAVNTNDRFIQLSTLGDG